MSKRFNYPKEHKKYIVCLNAPFANFYYEGYLYNTNEVNGKIQEHYKTRAGDLHIHQDKYNYIFDNEIDAICKMVELTVSPDLLSSGRFRRAPYEFNKMLRIAKKFQPELFI